MLRMRKMIWVVGFLLSYGIGSAQTREKPDMAAIQKTISDKSSPSYYPKLMKRFKKLDTSLTHEQYRLLYYGYTLQPEYLQLQRDDWKLIQYMKDDDLRGIEKESEFLLYKYPFCLLALYQMGYVEYRYDSTNPDWRLLRMQYHAIRKAILSSGDGYTAGTAIKVSCSADEFNIMRDYFKIVDMGEQTLEGVCDRIEVEPTEKYRSKVIYFDISSDLERAEKILTGNK